MKFGSMKEVLLSQAKDLYLFDCRMIGLDPKTVTAHRHVLTSFIQFTGNILMKELTPDHVHIYIANLSDGPSEGEEHTLIVRNHYAIIYLWIRWMHAQGIITERGNGFVKPPRRLTNLFPSHLLTRSLTYC